MPNIAYLFAVMAYRISDIQEFFQQYYTLL
jgi:hypothetical protein